MLLAQRFVSRRSIINIYIDLIRNEQLVFHLQLQEFCHFVGLLSSLGEY